MKKIIIVLIAVLGTSSAFSQREVNMFFLENVLQSSYVNPMAIPEHKVSLGLPGISSVYVEALHPSFAFGDLHDGKSWLIEDLLNNQLKDKNLIGTSAYVDLFNFRFKAGNNFISFTNVLKTDIGFTYPGDLFRFGWYGNGSDQQSDFDFSGLGFNASIYSEHGLGITYAEKNWTWGGKLKVYNGLANLKMKMNSFDMNFKQGEFDNYDAIVDADMTFLVTTIPGEVDIDSLVEGSNVFTDGSSIEEAMTLETFLEDKDHRPIFKNFGLGIDFGGTYHLSDKIDLSASIVDLGYIRWKLDVYEYNAGYQFGYDGFEFDLLKMVNDSTGDYSDSLFTALEDSATGGVYSSSSASSFVTMPIFKMYIGGKYKLFDRTHINALFNLSVNSGVRASFTLGIYQEVRRFLNISITNTVQYGQLWNLGFGLVVKPGPFQIYLAADNISSALLFQQDVNNSSLLIPHQLNQFNFRVGMNLVFGRNKVQEKLQGIVE